MKKLKICPFCGSDDIRIRTEEDDCCCKKPSIYYGIGCKTINCHVSDGECFYKNESEAIEAWNKRA